jgi:hypothetical protein
MLITQLHALVNNTTMEVLGETAVIQDDLSNIVDIGKQVIDTDNVDNYVKKLVNHIGKVIFVNRLYSGGVPSVLMDSWEYGSILEKVTADMPTATENKSWDLNDGEDYSPNVFYKPSVSAKFFNSMVTFEIPMSFTEIQVKQSFSNAAQLNGFVSMLVTSIENAMTVRLDALIMRTITNMAAETLVNELSGELDDIIVPTNSTVKAVNLLSLFNADKVAADKTTKAKALQNPNFIRYAAYTIGLYTERMAKISTLFNVGAKERFTPKDMLHTILLADFAKASVTFLGADVYNAEHMALPTHETVPYWQGSGLAYEFGEISRVNVKTSTNKDVDIDGVLGVMFDRDALGVTNLERRVTTNYNPKAEFYNNFYKFDAGYYNDLNENFVVFFMG